MSRHFWVLGAVPTLFHSDGPDPLNDHGDGPEAGHAIGQDVGAFDKGSLAPFQEWFGLEVRQDRQFDIDHLALGQVLFVRGLTAATKGVLRLAPRPTVPS